MTIVAKSAKSKSPLRSNQSGNWRANPSGQKTGKWVDKSTTVGRLLIYGWSAGVNNSHNAKNEYSNEEIKIRPT